MNLDPITMDKAAAEEAFAEYRGAFMAERNRIDGELMRGYRALKEGKQLLRMSQTIAFGGVNELGYPKLALSRADEREISVWVHNDGRVGFAPSVGSRARDRSFDFPADTLPRRDNYLDRRFAIVPLVPPRFRPPHSLKGYHLLWEAEWTTRSKVRAPRDPALLKHLGGDLWAVLAVWDLTPLEQAVLEMRPQ